MSQNHCEHIHPDGARCQAHPQTGKSFCFFHDPTQEKNRARARRNGGYMRGRYIDSGPDASPVALNLGPICAKTVDDLREYMERAVNRYDQGDLDDANMATINTSCNFLLRCHIEKRRLRQEAAREAHRVEAAAGAAAESQKKEAAAWVEAPGFSPVKGSGDEQFHSAEGQRGAERSATKAQPEAPIIIDASKPWDLSQFGGKKPRISCVVPVFTSMRTGKIFDVNEPNPLDPPEHMLRDEFRRKPAASTPTAAPAEESRECGTNEGLVGHGFSHDGAQRTEPFQRREGEITEEEHLAAAACPGVPSGPRPPPFLR